MIHASLEPVQPRRIIDEYLFADCRVGRPNRELVEQAPVVDPDLVFVPLACFDRRGNRIGYGAGYYDLTLARLRAMKPVRAAGTAYGVCEVAAVPYENHDQTLDAVVTEQETILFNAQ